MTLDELNRLPASRAEAEFRRCCGSARWASAMAAARPFATLEAMQAAGDAISASLGKTDWLEAFAAHPRIGQREGGSAWSAGEQAGMRAAGDDTKARLGEMNERYLERFGYIFIVCATGKAPEEMLARLEARMSNDPAAELSVAADEQRKITKLRLAKLLETNR